MADDTRRLVCVNLYESLRHTYNPARSHAQRIANHTWPSGCTTLP